MRDDFLIENVTAREILDSRANPTVEAEVTLTCGVTARGAAPSGASTGQYEALEKRDRDETRYGGKGVRRAVEAVRGPLCSALLGLDARDTAAVDHALLQADGTADKSNYGANALLAVSIAAARAAAGALELPLYRFLGGVSGCTLPLPMMNILNGGAHAANSLDVQEYMILPAGAGSFAEAVRMCAEVYHALQGVLREKGLATAVGDEGGFAPDCADDAEALELILQAIETAHYRPGKDVYLALDAAASEWKTNGSGQYRQPKSGQQYQSACLADYWAQLCAEYPIVSIEDPLDEEDWDGWRELTATLGRRVQLVGDDLFVTNTDRLQKGIAAGCANAILVKPNQIGTLTETMSAVRLARRAGYAAILSHRSGETADTTIADLAVGLNAGLIKTGAPCRAERTEKYNRLLRIEEQLAGGIWPGGSALAGARRA